MRIAGNQESPLAVEGGAESDTNIGNDLSLIEVRQTGSDAPSGCQQRFAVIVSAQSNCLAQLSGSGAQSRESHLSAALLHGGDSGRWFDRSNQNDAIASQHNQQPVHSIADICVHGPRSVRLKKSPR